MRNQRMFEVPLLWVTICLTLGLSASGVAALPFSSWSPIGPSPLDGGQTYGGKFCRVPASGRASSIAVNPLNPDDVWLGAAAGGAWHSTDAGLSWTPMTDDQASLAVGAIALDNCDAQATCSTRVSWQRVSSRAPAIPMTAASSGAP